MFALDPINAITSVQFYKRVAQQSAARTFGYLCYISLVFAAAATVALKVKLGPSIDSTFDWLAKSVPAMEFADGHITAPFKGPITVQHPDYRELTLVIDLDRAQPVTPATLDAAKAMAYLTANALYLRRQPMPGESGASGLGSAPASGAAAALEVFDFAKAKTAHVSIGPAFFDSAKRLFNRIMYPIAFVLGALFFGLWRLLVTLLYSVVLALLMNSASEANLPYSQLLPITLYAQTLIIALQIIFLFMPVGIPFGPAVSLAATGTYIWLALKAQLPAEPAPIA